MSFQTHITSLFHDRDLEGNSFGRVISPPNVIVSHNFNTLRVTRFWPEVQMFAVWSTSLAQMRDFFYFWLIRSLTDHIYTSSIFCCGPFPNWYQFNSMQTLLSAPLCSHLPSRARVRTNRYPLLWISSSEWNIIRTWSPVTRTFWPVLLPQYTPNVLPIPLVILK